MELANFDLIKSKGKTFGELYDEVLSDQEVMEFIANNRIPETIVRRYFSKIFEYYQHRDSDGATTPKLLYDEGYISCVYAFQDNDKARRTRDGVSTSLVLDKDFESLRGLQLKDLNKDKDNTLILKAFERLIQNHSYPNGTSGVWLRGSFGVGKTYMMGAVANELNAKGAGVVFRNLTNIMQDVYQSFNYKDNRAKDIEKQLKHAEVLIIDDIGAENITDYTVSYLLGIFQHRFENQLLTFFTSNLSQEEYRKELEGRISRKLDAGRLLERIRGLTKEVTLKGANKRFRAK